MTNSYSRAAVLIPFLATIGCASASMDPMDGTEDEQVTETTQEVVSSNRLTMNRLTMNRLTMNSLSGTKLSPNGKQVSATTLVNTEDGREVLRYLVRCALPESASLTATVNGTTYVFQGLVGLAPDWMVAPLTGTGRRWLTACLLAHVNGYGVQVSISVRGGHPSLTADMAEHTTYGVQEVSFFGDIFGSDEVEEDDADGPAPAALPLYACGGNGVQASCGSDPATFRPARSCATPEDCQIQFIGACHDTSGAGAHVCGTVLSNGYSKCHTTKKTSGSWQYGQTYSEVITVYMAPSDFNAFYTGCAPAQ
jgi:hypothetical protein